jgi:tetratricopeptide (TPR) repeat protein
VLKHGKVTFVFRIAGIFLVAICLLSGASPASASSSSAQESAAKKSQAAKGHTRLSLTKHRIARKGQGPASFDEIFPPGHKFTPEEKQEASAFGVFCDNGQWKDAYKFVTKAVKQHPERWWLYAARAAAAANLNRHKDVIDAVDHALQTNNGDANRLNVCQLQILKANALSRLGNKAEAVNTFLQAAKADPKDPYSRSGAAWLYATTKDSNIHNPAAAMQLATEAAKLAHQKDATILDVLAAAYAARGDFTSAQRWEGKAILAGDAEDVPQFQRRLVYYQTNKPWNEDSK